MVSEEDGWTGGEEEASGLTVVEHSGALVTEGSEGHGVPERGLS
jgi:hypothetical protein